MDSETERSFVVYIMVILLLYRNIITLIIVIVNSIFNNKKSYDLMRTINRVIYYKAIIYKHLHCTMHDIIMTLLSCCKLVMLGR